METKNLLKLQNMLTELPAEVSKDYILTDRTVLDRQSKKQVNCLVIDPDLFGGKFQVRYVKTRLQVLCITGQVILDANYNPLQGTWCILSKPAGIKLSEAVTIASKLRRLLFN